MHNQKVPTLIAHRGYRKRYPENTWIGLKNALDVGACWLEFDVQLCADMRFVLLHDSDFARISDTQGSIFDITTKELDQISVHEPNRFGDRFFPMQISILDDVLDSLSDYPNVHYMVEIKEESLKHWGLSKVMNLLLEKLNPVQSNSVLISFSYDAVEYAKRHSDIRIGLVLDKYNQESKYKADSLAPDFLICNYSKLPDDQSPWSGPWEWMLYEINLAHELLAWGERGIKYIETGDIGAVLTDQILSTRICHHGI